MTRILLLLLKGVLGLAAALALVVAGVLLFMPGIHSSSITMMLNTIIGVSSDTSDAQLLQQLQLPEGFSLSIYARGISNPRMLQVTESGRLLVSSPRSGEVFLLSDNDGDGFADHSSVLLQALTRPHGLELYNGYLYVAESNRIGRVGYDDSSGELTGSYEVLVDGLTDDGNHWSKTVKIDEAGWMYVAMGSTCNVCVETDPRRASIVRYRADGSEESLYASGLRNSVGMDFAPWDGALYATDNGRDLLSDDFPPCELNHIEQGAFYGWPNINGFGELDPDFGAGREDLLDSARDPVFGFAAHNAPLGMHFVTSEKLPEQYARSALVALHGSWNRSEPDGYKVVSLHWDEMGKIHEEEFLGGFLSGDGIIGRPVDVSADGRGGFFISDDYARVIYRVSYGDNAPSAAGKTLTVAATGDPAATPQVVDPQLAALGEKVYTSLPCAECHGEQAVTPVPLQYLKKKYTLVSLADYFVTPTPPMPQYPLTGEQRQQLAHFLLRED